MRKAFVLLGGALVLATGLSGCGKTRLTHRGTPDEFAISRNAPLVVPQDFNLTPPRPGQPRAVAQDAQGAAVEALFGPGVRVPAKSQAEQNLLDKAGAAKTDPAIRSQAGDPKTPTVNKGAFVRELMGAPAGTIDAKKAKVAITG